MATLRFNRDRRGYETTALVEAGGGRRRKGQRLLYFFRTPPAVRVGREAIDAEAMRLLEEHNPDVTFDWPRLLKTVPAGPAPSVGSARPPREERRRDRRDQRSAGQAEPRPRHDAGQGPPSPAEPFESPAAEEQDADEAEAIEDGLFEPVELSASRTAVDSADLRAVADATPPDTDAAPRAADVESSPQPEPMPPLMAATPAPIEEPLPERYARLGHDGMIRLRARYADVRARLQASPVEEREELLGRAERLNPDAWLTDADVAQALEEYEPVFESLRPFLGRPGRPPRRL